MIHKQSQKFPYEHREDLVQIGYIALFKAHLAFKPEKGYKFITLAYHYTYNAMKRYMRDSAELIKIPARKYEEGLRFPIVSLDMHITEDLTLLDKMIYEDNTIYNIDRNKILRMLTFALNRTVGNHRDRQVYLEKVFFNTPTHIILEEQQFTKQNLSVKIQRISAKLKKFFKERGLYEI